MCLKAVIFLPLAGSRRKIARLDSRGASKTPKGFRSIRIAGDDES